MRFDRKLWLLIIITLAPTGAFARTQKISDVKAAVQNYYVGILLDHLAAKKNLSYSILDNRPPHPGCEPHPATQCVDVACAKLGSWGCDELSEIQRVADACRGNYDGNCLQDACSRLGSWGCDEMSEIKTVAISCRGNYGNCFQVVCDKLGSWGCDELSEIQKVSATCQNVDGDCVQSVCARLGSWGCDELSEIQKVAKTCSGQL